MAYTRFRNGFDIATNSAVDKRVYLTKAEMVTAEDNFTLPDVYFAICPDDGKLYIYNKANEATETTGKFKPVENTTAFIAPDTEESVKAFNEAVAASAPVAENTKAIEEVQKQLGSLIIDGGEVQASYNLIGMLKNITADSNNATEADYNGSAKLTFAAATSYNLPNEVLVNNVTVKSGLSTYTDCNGCNARWSFVTPGLLELEAVTNIVYYTIEGIK